MINSGFRQYWRLYRLLYLDFWLVVSLFYGSRAVETLRYWDQLAAWQVSPGRMYMLLTGVVLCLLGLGAAVFFFIKRDAAAWGVIGLSVVYFLWLWLDRLWITGTPEPWAAVFWLGLGTVGYALWTVLVFRKEIFHDRLR